MKIAFTTLGSPNWDWEKTLQEAARLGYDGLELRGVNGEMDLPKAGPFLPENLAATKRQLQDKGLEICCLGSSARFDTQETLDENLDLAKRHIDLAAELQAPYVRVFGDRIPDPAQRRRVVEQVAGALTELADYAKGTGVVVVQETHGDFSRSEDILEVMELVERPEVRVLWDMHHPYRFFGEKPEETWQRIGRYVVHTHIKDSTGTRESFRYCLVGDGDIPLRSFLKLLKDAGYDNWLVLEWEKKWHPEIEEPEVAYPRFRDVIRRYWEEV